MGYQKFVMSDGTEATAAFAGSSLSIKVAGPGSAELKITLPGVKLEGLSNQDKLDLVAALTTSARAAGVAVMVPGGTGLLDEELCHAAAKFAVRMRELPMYWARFGDSLRSLLRRFGNDPEPLSLLAGAITQGARESGVVLELTSSGSQ